MSKIRVIPAGQVASMHNLLGDRVTLGRNKTNAIVIRESAASSYHAEFVNTPGGWQIRDLNSKNGTFVNGLRAEVQLLHPGDSIRIGNTEIRFDEPIEQRSMEESISRAEYMQKIISINSAAEEMDASQLPDLIIDDTDSSGTRTAPVSDFSSEVMHSQVIGEMAESLPGQDREKIAGTVDTTESESGAEAKLRLVQRVSEKLVGIFEPRHLLDEIMAIVVDQFHADRGFLCLLDEEGDPRPIAAHGIRRNEKVNVSRTVLNRLLGERSGIVLERSDQSSTGNAQESLSMMEVYSTMCVPLWTGDTIMGILSLDSTDPEKIFSRQQLDLLIAVAHQVAIGIERSRLSDQMEAERQLRDYLSKYLDQHIVQQISQGHAEGKDPLVPAEREVTILFSDIVSFTKMSEPLSPLELAEFVSEYLTAMTDIIFQHGGTIDKYIGDAVMALFGAPVSSDESVAHAIRAALAMVERIKTIQLPGGNKRKLRIRIGINTGSVVVGNLGSQGRREYTAVGDAVNVASRLETFARPNEICIDELTYQQTEGLFEVAEIGHIDVKNRAEPVVVYRVIGER
ncbi:MAG: adenylate/guanylate cyclase domain-containing protein [Pirellulaceae bacterium]